MGKWGPKTQEEPDFGPWSDGVDLGGYKYLSLDRWPYSKLVHVETSIHLEKIKLYSYLTHAQIKFQVPKLYVVR